MESSEIDTKEVLLRLKNIRGHVAGIERMVDEGCQCRDVIAQLDAVKASVDKLERQIMGDWARISLGRVACQEAPAEELEAILDTILRFL